MRHRRIGPVVIALGVAIAAGCSGRPTSPSAPPAPLPQRVELVRGQSVTVPGTTHQLTLRNGAAARHVGGRGALTSRRCFGQGANRVRDDARPG
jgi:hypothetical protein